LQKKRINEFILPGSLVSISINDEQTWSLNIVYQCLDDSIDIPLTHDLIETCIFVDEGITIKYKNEYFEYTILGSISKIELCGSPFVRINVLDILENINNRTFPRYDVYLPANLSFDSKSDYFCTVSNISLGGIALLIDKELPVNIECEINILLNESNSVFGRGIPVRCSPHGSFHNFCMQFTYMDEENSNSLSSYLCSIDASYDYLRSKYLIDSRI